MRKTRGRTTDMRHYVKKAPKQNPITISSLLIEQRSIEARDPLTFQPRVSQHFDMTGNVTNVEN